MVSWEANIPSDLWSIRFGLQPQWVVLTMEASLGSEHSYLTYWLFVFWSWLKLFSSQKKMMWFVLAGLLLAREAFSTAAQVACTVHMVFIIKTVCLHYVILEMHSFPMSAAKHFYDNPLSIYLDPKIVLIYRLHPVYALSVKWTPFYALYSGCCKRNSLWPVSLRSSCTADRV